MFWVDCVVLQAQELMEEGICELIRYKQSEAAKHAARDAVTQII